MLNDKNTKCTLLSYSVAEDPAGFVDDAGTVEERTTVWCKVQSVSGREIATMGQNNIKPSLKVTLWVNEYANQDTVEVDGKVYGVYRTYQNSADEIELYLERKAGAS